MRLNRVAGDAQPRADVARLEFLADEPKHLHFTGPQQRQRFSAATGAAIDPTGPYDRGDRRLQVLLGLGLLHEGPQIAQEMLRAGEFPRGAREHDAVHRRIRGHGGT